MGHKGVSKRKPKKSKSFSDNNINDSSKARPGESPSVQALVKDRGAPLNQGNVNLAAGLNKKNRKGK